MAKKKPVQQKFENQPNTQRQRLEHLILATKAAITTKGDSVDKFFTDQLKRLEKQLKDMNK